MPTTIIEPSTGWVSLKFRELWSYRELLYFLSWRDVKVRYKQSVLGIAWALFQPLMLMVVFTFIGGLAEIPSGGLPRPIFVFAALVPWVFFANGLNQSSNSLVASSNLITKVYFPRLVVPIAAVIAGFVDFMVSFVVLLGMMVYFGVLPTVNVVFLPLFVLLTFVTALGVGLWLSALNVKYRDVRLVVPFLIQAWLFATPIAYSANLVDSSWRPLLGLNPMAGVAEGFRWALLDTDITLGPMLIVSVVTALAVLISGAFFFRRTEKTFADVV